MEKKHFLKLLDYTPEEINSLLDLAADLKAKKKNGVAMQHRICLFMVFPAGGNLKRAINLFQQHHARQLMREGHRSHGQLEIRLCLYPVSHTEGGADQETGAAFSCVFCAGISVATDVSSMGKRSAAETFSFGIRAAGLGVTVAMSPVAAGFGSESAIGWMSCASEG